MKPNTVQEFFNTFPDNEACLEHLFQLRYGNSHQCPKCAKISSKWHKLKGQPAYSCQWCGHHIHPMVGTPFEKSRTSLQLWFFAIYLFVQTRSGVSAKELQRQLGVTYKCAWRMGHEIRKHMGNINNDGGKKFEGNVEIDEGFFGKSAVVLGMVERKGNLKTKVFPPEYYNKVMTEVFKNVRRTSTIHTDASSLYYDLKRKGYHHEVANHSKEEYNTQTLDSYWARLKMSIRGTHVWVSSKHLDKYADEFAYRFSRRRVPERMLDELLSSFPKPSN